ncbi:MAG: hypothetical protein JNG88_16935 [Phycisphaerales bacterium]|nr:hypothetical protein [Phycisphaerales bacterium]
MSQEWNLPRHATVCGTCGHEFEIGASFRVFLSLIDGAFRRDDVCDACAEPGHGGVVGWWRTRRKAPPEKRTHAFDREAIYAFFSRLDDEAQIDKRQFRFVLALLLWRKKVLKLVEATNAEAGEIWKYVAIHDGKSYAVVRPEMDEQQMESLSEQLESLLAGSDATDGEAAPVSETSRA